MTNRRSACLSFTNMLKFGVLTLIMLPVSTLIKAISPGNEGFPESGTFKQQDDFVNSLTSPCDSAIADVVQSVVNAEDPFHAVDTHVHSDKNIKVWHHDFSAEFGVVTRRTKESNKNNAPAGVVDVEEVMIGGEAQDGSLQPLTFRFVRDKNGLMKPVAKEKVPVTDYAEGVQQANKEGLVVRANSCYTSKLRDKKVA